MSLHRMSCRTSCSVFGRIDFVVVHKSSPKGIHFRRARPHHRADEVHACTVTCGGLCPELNIVIRELVCGLYNMYGVKKVLETEVIDKSFGFDTIVEKAQWDINTAHVESESKENGIELLKLMGSYCDKFVALEKSSFRSL
ncbi:ATP-dependent 6-phosphofructokinase 4 [Cucumis melo var. makuwa]|uniref:ATP-dependent 6-phosphofructokinase 4 n=1 Tax=Cucumis melo var. makuwa TaxID=1194695 RepID=A0A5A7V994_CUCMM|nr:ATP-dependent 6-phosphofructokinase 4 [Cucumis melo var. makuwa]